MENYNDIINMPHHVSIKHPKLSMEQRAAQFAPFAALTGYGESVNETERFTENRIELTTEEENIINSKLQKIENKIQTNPKVSITYFVPDLKKSGGEYITVIDNVKKINKNKLCLILNNGREISISEIIDIQI